MLWPLRATRRCEPSQRRVRIEGVPRGPLLAPPQNPTVGDFVRLCLLIDFGDAPATIARDEVDRFCNQPGYSGFGNNGSAFDFFRDNSIGRCRYTNIVEPYYRAARPKAYYTAAPSSSRSAPSGREATPPDAGLAIWHIDEDGDDSHEQMTAASHYELSLKQADGLFQLARRRRRPG